MSFAQKSDLHGDNQQSPRSKRQILRKNETKLPKNEMKLRKNETIAPKKSRFSPIWLCLLKLPFCEKLKKG